MAGEYTDAGFHQEEEEEGGCPRTLKANKERELPALARGGTLIRTGACPSEGGYRDQDGCLPQRGGVPSNPLQRIQKHHLCGGARVVGQRQVRCV